MYFLFSGEGPTDLGEGVPGSELESLLGTAHTREGLCEIVHKRIIDIEKLKMPSFDAFRARLEEVI